MISPDVSFRDHLDLLLDKILNPWDRESILALQIVFLRPLFALLSIGTLMASSLNDVQRSYPHPLLLLYLCVLMRPFALSIICTS